MARKPSIFSSNYEMKMKKHRRKVLYIIAIVFLVCGIVFLIFFNTTGIRNVINNGLKSIKSSFSKNTEIKDKNIVANTQNNKQSDKKTKEVKKDKLQTSKSEVRLTGGNTIKLVVQDKNKQKVIKTIELDENSMNYSLSPSGKSAVVYEKNNQIINYVDINGTVTDITQKQYNSTTGKKFTKEAILSQNAQYIWAMSPKFIDEENVAYISNLPWFKKKENKYIWICNIKENTYRNVQLNGKEITGININFKTLTDKGLEVDIDGVLKHITVNGITD